MKYVVWALSDVSGASAVFLFLSLSLSYSLQQSNKKRGRQRKVGFLLSGIITKDPTWLWFPAFVLTVELTIMYFFIPLFPLYFWRGRWGTKQPSSLAIKAERPSRQPSNCHLPPPQIASLPPLLPSRYLVGFSEAERMADNCLCASCCTCHQPAIETLIIFLIIAKRLVFLPLSSLEDE